MRPETVLAPGSPTIQFGRTGKRPERPENFLRNALLQPVHRMPLVEIIRGEKSSGRSIAKVVARQQMGKTPIVVNDCPGFANRVLLPISPVSSQLLRDGADFAKSIK